MTETVRGEWLWAVASVAAAGIVAALDPVGSFIDGWIAYASLFLAGGVLLRLVWGWLDGRRGGRTLILATSVAVVLRLMFALTFTAGLPTAGYPDSIPHRNGYYYLDAYLRDRDAWQIARSEDPLSETLIDPEQSDQYGGLLLASAVSYRVFSPSDHRPMVIGGLAAYASGLAVLFTWAFAGKAFGSASSVPAAWIVAVFPEAVFLGASQMREPFLIAALAIALYGYSLLREAEVRRGAVAILASLAIAGLISPPYALLFGLSVLGAWLWEGTRQGARLMAAIAGLVALALVLTLVAWSQIGNAPSGGPLGLLDWWINSGAQFELVRLERGSGLVQKYFELAPEWAHMPMATGYGLIQPFLPAALMDATSLPLPRLLGVLRGAGWFALLPFLIYAPLAAIRSEGLRSLQTYLGILVWLIAIGAAFRLAGDQWDNPRARTVYLAAQAALAGWALMHARRTSSPWLARTAIVIGIATVVFLQWYAGRYYHTPRLNLYQTLGALVALVGLFLGASLLRDQRRLTGDTPEV